MAKLRLERVSKQYDTASWGVRALDLLVDEGELVAVVGASGSGKTTLLRLIAGLEQLSDGDIFIGGRQVTSDPPWKRDVGLVSEAAALMPQLTVEENLDWSRRQRKRRSEDQASGDQASGYQASGDSGGSGELSAARIAEMLGLNGVLGRRPAELSAGQQQRVALGRALASRPRVMLLDEPLGRIDGPGRQSLAWELKRIQQLTRTTWVYVTHDRQEAVTVADRVAVLHEGRLLQVGTDAELRRRPSHLRVMAWWWDGWLSGLAGQCEVVNVDGQVATRFRAPQLPESGLPLPSGLPATARPLWAVWPADRVRVNLAEQASELAGTRNEASETRGPVVSDRTVSGRMISGPKVAVPAAVSFGRVVERREWADKTWALVGLEPTGVSCSAPVWQGFGDWEMSFAASLAQGWVWGRIEDEISDNGRRRLAPTATIEVGSRVAVEFNACDACWFER
jgi:multiple sugar transport system ATP-binding protein